MKTIQTHALIGPDGKITLQLPDLMEPGRYPVTVVIDDRPITHEPDFGDFPVHDVGPWPEGLSLRREDMYGDDGR